MQNSTEIVGHLEVKISVSDTSATAGISPFLDAAQRTTTDIKFSDQMADDIISVIALRLARQNVSVELMFGIFSNGNRTCTKEDFKHCLLHRLGLNADLSERELDVFLAGRFDPRKNYIDKAGFMDIFNDAIAQAKSRI